MLLMVNAIIIVVSLLPFDFASSDLLQFIKSIKREKIRNDN